jgi:hypothetical protein
MTNNLKSKACPGPRSGIENLKSNDPVNRAPAGKSDDSMTKEGQQASVVSNRGDQRLLDDVPVACSFSMTQRRINVASRTRLLLATCLTSFASSGRNRTVTAVVGLRVNTGVVTLPKPSQFFD